MASWDTSHADFGSFYIAYRSPRSASPSDRNHKSQEHAGRRCRVASGPAVGAADDRLAGELAPGGEPGDVAGGCSAWVADSVTRAAMSPAKEISPASRARVSARRPVFCRASFTQAAAQRRGIGARAAGAARTRGRGNQAGRRGAACRFPRTSSTRLGGGGRSVRARSGSLISARPGRHPGAGPPPGS